LQTRTISAKGIHFVNNIISKGLILVIKVDFWNHILCHKNQKHPLILYFFSNKIYNIINKISVLSWYYSCLQNLIFYVSFETFCKLLFLQTFSHWKIQPLFTSIYKHHNCFWKLFSLIRTTVLFLHIFCFV